MRALLVCVVAAGVGLRYWRIHWGLDDGLLATDEWAWAGWLRPFATPGCAAFATTDLVYPTAFRFLAGAAASLAALAGLVPPPSPDAPTWTAAVVVGRHVAVLASLGGIAGAYATARRIAGPRAAWMAAACLAALPFDVMQPHYVSVDPLLACAVAWTLWAAVRLADRGGVGDAVVAGACAGLAMASKYSGVIAVVPVAWAAGEVAWRTRRPARLAGLGVAAAAGALLAVVVACPACLTRPDLLAGALAAHRMNVGARAADFWNAHLVPTLGWWGRPVVYQLVAALPYTMSLGLYALALAGAVHAAARGGRGDRVVLAAAAATLVGVGASPVTILRYLLPLFPALAVIAGCTAARLRHGALALAVALAWALANAAVQADRFSHAGAQAVAAWIADHPPPAAAGAPARVAFPGHVGGFHLPELLTARGLVPAGASGDEPLTATRPDAIVVPDWYATHLRRDVPDSRGTATLDAIAAEGDGWRRVAVFPARRWPQHPLDVRLDPAFASDLWQGDVGFTVYYRDAGG